MLRDWNDLPNFMKTDAVRPYYDELKKREVSLYIKRIFDFIVSMLMIIILSPLFLAISVAIVFDSRGGIFFRQERITQYGKKFLILKFRTMIPNAEQMGTQVTIKNDIRVTNIGKFLRKYRLDELPQLINIIFGEMSFVGTRPEATRFIKGYTPEMMATFLLPAGVTSIASILYKDEEDLLETASNIDEVYINKVLPEKMKYNLQNIKKFSIWSEIGIMVKTVVTVVK